MRKNPVAAVGIALAMMFNSAASAQAPATDEWDYGEDAAKKLSIAAVTFETFGVAVRCLDDRLSVVVSGLPVASGERRLRYQMGAVEEAESLWVSGRNSPAAFAVWPRRIAGDLSRGGTLSLAAMDGDQVRRYRVDLPPSTSAIPRVMAACGHELETESDAPTGESFAGLRWVRRPDVSFPSRTMAESGIAAIQCWVREDGGMRDCEIESEFPEGAGFGRAATLGSHRSARVAPSDSTQTIAEGRRAAFLVRYNSYEALMAPPPSRLPDREGAYDRLNGAPDSD